MSSAANVFPAFIRAEFDGANAFSEFTSQSATAARQVERQWKGSLAEISAIAQRSLTMPASQGGAIDLGVPQMREAARATEQRALALREMADAAAAVTAREGQLSAAQQSIIASTQAAAVAAEQEVVAERERIAVYEQIQVQANATAAATGSLTAASRASAVATASTGRAAGGAQIAQMELMHVIRSSADAFAAGQSAGRIFAMEIGRVAEAASYMGPSLGRVGAFLSGGWGLALTAGISILSIFATRTHEAETAQLSLADASNTLGHAQGLLGNLVDLATGKISTQNVVVREAIRLQAVLAQIEANRAGQAAGARLGAMAPNRYLDERGRGVSRASAAQAGIFSDGSDITGSTATTGLQDNPGVETFQELVATFRGNANADVRQFRERLEALRSQGQLPGLDVNAAVAEALRIASGRNEISTMRDVQRVAEGGAVPAYLLHPRAGGRPRRERRPTDQTEFGEDAGARISNITARFQDSPPQVEAVRRALSELNDVASDVERRRPPNYEALISQLREAKTAAIDGLQVPLRQYLEQQDRELEVQRLIDSGRADEATALQAILRIQTQMGKLDDDQKAAITNRIALRAEETRQAEILQQREQANQRAVGELRSSLENIFADPRHGLANLPATISQSFNQLNGQAMVERLFGPALRELDDFASGRTRLKASNEALAATVDRSREAVDRQKTAADDLTEKLGAVATSAKAASDALAGIAGATPGSDLANWDNAGNGAGWRGNAPQTLAMTRLNASIGSAIDGAFDTIRESIAAAANENPDIFVHGIRPPRPASNDNATAKPVLIGPDVPDPRQLYRRAFTDLFVNVFHDKRVGTAFGNVVTNGLEGAQFGSMLQGVLQIGGVRLPSGLAQAGGALLNQIPGFSQAAGPIGLAIAGNQEISHLIGNDEIKNGKLLSLVIGPFLTRLFGSALRGSSTITGVDSPITTTGNSSKYEAASSSAAGSVQEMLAHIADALGATVTGAGAVSIGVRKGNYRVDPTGRGVTKTSKGAIDFGKDADAAVRAAVLDLIKDGVIGGLRQGAQVLLQSAKDIDTGIQKALDFESVFSELKQQLDPVGAALDTLDKRFSHLKDIFEQAGASTEEYAQLEQLYQLDRKDAITQAGEQMTSALKGLLADLTTNNEALSLRDRLAAAHATYDPLAARVAAGDTTVDYSAFSDAAKTLVDIERQIDGSTQPYFDLLKSVTDLAQSTLTHQEDLISIANARTSPLGDPSSPVSTSNPDTVSAIDRLSDTIVSQIGGELRASNDNLASIIGLLASGDRGGGGALMVDRMNF